MHESEIELSADVALLRSSAVPPRRVGGVLSNAVAFAVHEPEIELSVGVSLFGGSAKPPHRFGVVLGNILAFGVHKPEHDLSLGETLLRSSAVPSCCLGLVLGNALAFVVHESEIELSTGVALLGVEPELEKGSGVVASLEGLPRLVEGLRHRRKHAHDHQQQCGGQGEESSLPVPFAHVPPAPVESRQPVGPLFTWYMNTYEKSAPVQRRQP